MEVHVRCPLPVCMERDTKGVYEKALTGEATTVPGVQVPYEAPPNPEVVVDTSVHDPKEGVARIVARLEELALI